MQRSTWCVYLDEAPSDFTFEAMAQDVRSSDRHLNDVGNGVGQTIAIRQHGPTWLNAGKQLPQPHARYTTRQLPADCITTPDYEGLRQLTTAVYRPPYRPLRFSGNHGRRNTPQYGGRLRLPQTRGRSRWQADPQHLSRPLEAIHR